MKAKSTIFPLILALILIMTGCQEYEAQAAHGPAGPHYLENPVALKALEGWRDKLNGLERSLHGEMLYVSLVKPVIVVSPDLASQLEVGGFGQDRTASGYGTRHALTTKLDKCVWLSTLVSYPLRAKLSITPGILVPEAHPKPSFAEIGAAIYEDWPSRLPAMSSIVTTSVEGWLAHPLKDDGTYNGSYGPYSNVAELIIEMAITPPRGDVWLDDMKLGFGPDDMFGFHLKANREGVTEHIVTTSVDVSGMEILPFLTKITEIISSTQGFYELTDEQIEWIAMEPVTRIRAWGDFLEGYASRETTMSCTGPNPNTPEQEYVASLYVALDKADPGNSASLLRGNTWQFAEPEDAFERWRKALKEKPYLPHVYRHLITPQYNYNSKTTEYFHLPIALRPAVDARPDIAEFHMRYAAVLLGQGKFDQAVEEYHTAQRIQPGFHLNVWQKLRPHPGNGIVEAAAENLIRFGEIVFADYPDDYSTQDYLAELYQQEGLFDKALGIYHASKNKNIGWNIAQDFKRRGMIYDAIALYEDMMEAHPDYTSIWRDLWPLYYQQGDTEGERKAHKWFIANVNAGGSGYDKQLGMANARLASLNGNNSLYIRYLLDNFPSNYYADITYLDLADAIGGEGYYRDALYLVTQVKGDLSLGSGGKTDSGKTKKKRSEEIWEKYVPLFWPEFKPEMATDVWSDYSEPYKVAEKMKRTDGIHVAVEKYRRLLDEYPHTKYASQYLQILKQIDSEDWERILEGELILMIIKEEVDGKRSSSNIRNFVGGRYNDYLKERLLEVFSG